MGNLLGWIRGLWEDRGERREPLEPLEPSEPLDVPVSSDISYNVQASSDISSDVQASSDISSHKKLEVLEVPKNLEVDVPVSSDISYNVQASSDISSPPRDIEPPRPPRPPRYKLPPRPPRYKLYKLLQRPQRPPQLQRLQRPQRPPRLQRLQRYKLDIEDIEYELLQRSPRLQRDIEYELLQRSPRLQRDIEIPRPPQGTKSPVEETARSLTDDQAEREILDIIQEIKQEIPGIQATRACRNLETRRFEITVISKRSNEARRRAKDIITKRNSKDLDYDLEVREITKEGITVTNSEQFTEFFAEKGYSKEIFKLQEVISKHSASFMKNEPNITCMSFSPVKSTGYGTAEHKILKESCIVFFVQVKFDKKRIPLGSQRIPEIIDDIKTDVREGIVESFMQPPWDALNIELGCPISAHKNGTLGPVVSNEQDRTGFLTSLHVLLSSSELTAVSRNMPNYFETGHGTPVHKVPKDENNEIGKVIEVYFANGDTEQLNSGYEVGLVELHSGVRIEKGNSQTNGLAHFMGETTAATENNCENAFKKLGAITGLTEGTFAGFCPARLEYDKDNIVVLYCQIGLYTKKGSRRNFAAPGDSGAIVTIEEANGDKIVGIFTGKCEGGPYIVTPIQPICDRLQMDGWTIGMQGNHNDNGVPMDI